MIHTNPQHPELIVAFRWRAVYKYYYFIIRGVTEKQAQEIVALPRHDEETIERCLFPVREKRTPPRSSRPGKLKLEPKRFGAYFEGMQTDAEKLDYIEEALMFYQEHQNQEG